MKRQWTRGEKWLWATPVAVGVFAAAIAWGPQIVRGALGEPQVWTTTDSSVRSIALSANGAVLAEAGSREGSRGWVQGSGMIHLWDARTGAKLPPIAPVYTRNKNGTTNGFDVWALELSPDAKQIGFSRVGDNWTLYNLGTRKLKWSFPRPISDAKFSPDGHSIALSNYGDVTIVGARDGKTRAHWKRSDSANSGDVSWSPDGKLVANIGAYKANDPIEMHRADNGQLVRRIPNQASHPMLSSVNFSPDGKKLVSACVPGNNFDQRNLKILAPVRCYDAATGKLIWEVKVAAFGGADWEYAAFCHAIFSLDGRTVAAYQYEQGRVFLLDSATGAIKSMRRFRTAAKSRLFVPPGLLFSPDGKRLFARGQNAVLSWDLE